MVRSDWSGPRCSHGAQSGRLSLTIQDLKKMETILLLKMYLWQITSWSGPRCSHGALSDRLSLPGSNLSNSSLITLSSLSSALLLKSRTTATALRSMWLDVAQCTVLHCYTAVCSVAVSHWVVRRCKSHSRLAGGNFTQFCQLIAIRRRLFIQVHPAS